MSSGKDRALERDPNINGALERFDCSSNSMNRPKMEHDIAFEETTSGSRGALRDRIAARSGFTAPTLNTGDSFQSTCLTISSPGFSPATSFESPVFLSNPLLSPTVGKLSSLSSDKDELYDDINASLAFQPISGTSLDPTNIGLEPDDSQYYEQRQLGGLRDSIASDSPADDGYNWRKYGQKLVKGREYPRSYYKCTHPNCEVKKKVERSGEGYIIEIIYSGSHNHPKTSPNRRSAFGSSGTGLDMQIDGTEQEACAVTNENIEWTSPVSEHEYVSHFESMQIQSGTQFGYRGPAAEALFRDEDKDNRASHMSVSVSYDREVDESESKRRKLEAYPAKMDGSTRASREPRIVVETKSDIDIIEDGYRWRKYGQKVVKGNPNPRSYYKCTATGCTVTKHVERASNDFKSVLTTYVGKHTHAVPATRNARHVGSGISGTLQGGLATRTHNQNVHYPVPQSRSEGMVTANSSLCDFQQRHPSGFVYIGQPEISDLSVPGLTIGQEKLQTLPAPDIGDSAGQMLLAAEPQVEPVSQQGLGLSASSLTYGELISRLSQI